MTIKKSMKIGRAGLINISAADRVDHGRVSIKMSLSHPSLRSWLDGLSKGHGFAAAFETRLKLSPGGATSIIVHGLEDAGYSSVAEAQRFIVKGKFGPLRDGELDQARQWGSDLAKAMG